MMFGDVGHGIMMLLFVAYLIAKEDEFMKVLFFFLYSPLFFSPLFSLGWFE